MLGTTVTSRRRQRSLIAVKIAPVVCLAGILLQAGTADAADPLAGFVDRGAPVPAPGWVSVVREPIDSETGTQAVRIVFSGHSGDQLNGELLIRGARVLDVSASAIALEAGDPVWLTGDTPNTRGLDGPQPASQVPTDDDPIDALRYGEGGHSVRFFMAIAGDDSVDSLRVIVQYPDNPGTASIALQVYRSVGADLEGWPPSAGVDGVVVGDPNAEVVDGGSFAGASAVGGVRLAVEDVDIEETGIVLASVQPGGGTRIAVVTLNNDSGGQDFDGDNGVDLVADRPVPTTVGLESLRVSTSALATLDGLQMASPQVQVMPVAPDLPVGGRSTSGLRLEVGPRQPPGFYVGQVVAYEDNNGNGALDFGEPFDWLNVEVTVLPSDLLDAGFADATDADGQDVGASDIAGRDGDLDDRGLNDGELDLDDDAVETDDVLPDLPPADASADVGDSSRPTEDAADAPSPSDVEPVAEPATDYGVLRGGEGCLSSVVGRTSGEGVGWLLALIGLFVVLRRRRGAWGIVVAASLVGVAASLVPSTARAVELDRFAGSPSPYRLGVVESPSLLPRHELGVRLDLDYLDEPLLRYVDGSLAEVVIASRTLVRAGAEYAVLDWLEVGLVVPFAIYQSGNEAVGDMALDSNGLLDVGLALRAALFEQGKLGGVTAQISGTVPTGSEQSTLGAGGFVGGGLLAMAWDTGPVALVSNLGYRYDGGARLLNLTGGHRVRAAFGVQVPWGETLLGSVEVVSEPDPAHLTSLGAAEAVLACRYHHASGWFGGTTWATTLSEGAGVPAWRAGLTLGLAPPRRRPIAESPVVVDTDGDGIFDDRDACINDPEDFDGWEDLDGCPEADNDGDGIVDPIDGAPYAAEDRDGFQDQDGVPDPDNDLDEVPDTADKSPNLPEDWDGDEDDDGVPEQAP